MPSAPLRRMARTATAACQPGAGQRRNPRTVSEAAHQWVGYHPTRWWVCQLPTSVCNARCTCLCCSPGGRNHRTCRRSCGHLEQSRLLRLAFQVAQPILNHLSIPGVAASVTNDAVTRALKASDASEQRFMLRGGGGSLVQSAAFHAGAVLERVHPTARVVLLDGDAGGSPPAPPTGHRARHAVTRFNAAA